MLKRICVLYSTCWELLGVLWRMVYGSWKISRLPHPIVTIFGGARLSQDSPYAHQAHQLGHALIRDEISVITGGGPGIMRAASCGASHEMRTAIKARSIGITVEGLPEEVASTECISDYFVMKHFFARKWLMIHYSVAFAVFPGGFGTLDEFAEIITLLQTKKMSGVSVVLIGTQYWEPFMVWVRDSALANGLIAPKDLDLFAVTDDLDAARALLKKQCEACKVPVSKM